ncbi:hypothetical protein SAMN04244548_03020 [Paracoccus pantotrophus]|nr:hypothetical protein SAMN04244548_03020 [Paracoccus pantotrophus]
MQGAAPWTNSAAIIAANKVLVFLHFNVFPAHQLGKGYTSIVSSDTADITMIIPGNATEEYPLNSMIELRGAYDTSCEGSAIYWKLAAPAESGS